MCVVRCVLLGVRCCSLPYAVWYRLLFVDCCVLCGAVCCLLCCLVMLVIFAVRCALFVVCCLLLDDRCALSVVCGSLIAVCWVLFVVR